MGYFSKLPHNEQGCNELAMYVTEMWDTHRLAEFAVEVLTERYLANKELFESDAKAEDELSGALDNPLDSDDQE